MTMQDVAPEVRFRHMLEFEKIKDLGLAEAIMATPNGGKKISTKKTEKKSFVPGSNGLIRYDSGTGGPGEESIHERNARERYWRSMGKKIRKGSSIK